jgi:hypothetical protein
MTRRNPLLLALTGALLVLVAAACAGGGGAGTAATTGGVRGTQATKTSSGRSEKATVRRVWTRFFSAQTSAREKQRLLQHGPRFSAALQAQAKSPLAGRSSAAVKSVTLEGPRRAKVRYTIDLGGKPALEHQTGTAVKENGSWKVGDASFCSLLKLGGTPPAACSSASG